MASFDEAEKISERLPIQPVGSIIMFDAHERTVQVRQTAGAFARFLKGLQ
jgi:DNA-binding LytR/AlgR family response regulator